MLKTLVLHSMRSRKPLHWQRIWLLCCLLGVSGSGVWAQEQVDFSQHIAPVLQQHCLRCHYPGNEQGDLSLATGDDLRELDYVVPGDADASHLVTLISVSGGDRPEMPAEGDRLNDAEVDVIRRWIDQGASWPEGLALRQPSQADDSWWSLQPLIEFDADPTVEPVEVIDQFIEAKLAAAGLSISAPADRRELIRRATYDLTGLPPTPQQVAQFVSDQDPQAYQKLIDRLLASPRYGERWGRHWLDVVRFGESNGFERNVIINSLWPFRDFVIRSLNEDLPMDQFIRRHLAGDVLGPGEADVAVGSAFLVAGPYDDVGNQDAAQAAQIRANTIDEMIRACSEAFLGLTVGCARCHDHKFDPIRQTDYYALYATFAGVRHGQVPLETSQQQQSRQAKLKPLQAKQAELETALAELDRTVLERARSRIQEYESRWTREPVDRTGTEERLESVTAKFVRLVCEASDINLAGKTFRIDEFEIWSDAGADQSVNVALASRGGKARGAARQIEDFPDAYGPHHAIDGKTGARFISTGADLTIELAAPRAIERIVFSSAAGETNPEHAKFGFVAEYRIEVSLDGEHWQQVASGADRKPITLLGQAAMERQRDRRLRLAEITAEEGQQQSEFQRQLREVKREIASIPTPPQVWIGTRVEAEAQGPFHVFLGGSPQREGPVVVLRSLSAIDGQGPAYLLEADASEAERRRALADWIVDPANPLTPRVLANRLWHYHFGTGIVDTPSDFGYMGGRPSHPQLLDWLAGQLIRNGWRLKPMHRLIMMSRTYQQSSRYQADAAAIDADARLRWRFSPRRLSAEEVRDTMLTVAGKLDLTMGGPGFRLYHFMQDNVCTYVPLDQHGPETYRRAVYHQNARASVVDLMTEFDQPDCAFSISRRAETTTPLQALTMLNHQFTVDMAAAMAQRLLQQAGDRPAAQIELAFQLCYARQPTEQEITQCRDLIAKHGLPALCRVLLNTSELIYLK